MPGCATHQPSPSQSRSTASTRPPRQACACVHVVPSAHPSRIRVLRQGLEPTRPTPGQFQPSSTIAACSDVAGSALVQDDRPVRRPRLAQRAALAAFIAGSACFLSACSEWRCNQSFDYTFTADAAGPATPRAAVKRWLAGDHEEAPDAGWTRDRATSPSSGIVYRSGDWRIEVVEAPGGGYLVGGGSCSRRT